MLHSPSKIRPIGVPALTYISSPWVISHMSTWAGWVKELKPNFCHYLLYSTQIFPLSLTNWLRDSASFHTVFYFRLWYSKWSSLWSNPEVVLWDAHTLQPAAVPGRVRALRAMDLHSAFTCVAGYYKHIILSIEMGASILVIAHHALW